MDRLLNSIPGPFPFGDSPGKRGKRKRQKRKEKGLDVGVGALHPVFLQAYYFAIKIDRRGGAIYAGELI
jgi:hypothetical protein